jgi:hypothetical protein
MKQIPSWDVNSHSAGEEILQIFMESETIFVFTEPAAESQNEPEKFSPYPHPLFY